MTGFRLIIITGADFGGQGTQVCINNLLGEKNAKMADQSDNKTWGHIHSKSHIINFLS